MPSPLVTSLSKSLHISVDRVEAAWKKAKVSAADQKHKSVPDLKGDDFALVTYITKKMLGVKDEIDVKAFLRSKKPAKEFIEDMVSTGAGIGHTLDTVVIPPKKLIAQPKDEDDFLDYGEDEEDVGTIWEHPNNAVQPVSTIAIGNTQKALQAPPKKPRPDIYENHSRINMADLAHQNTGASERLAALAGVEPDAPVAPVPESVAEPRGRTAQPVTVNRSRLSLGDLQEATLEAEAGATRAVAAELGTADIMADFEKDLENFVGTDL
jgi:hypothetical protein